MPANVCKIVKGTATYATGDPKTAFQNSDSTAILREFGPPHALLTTSTKVEKCGTVGVLSRLLYMTPGLFCPSSTAACRAGCLGHTSGRMHMQGPTRARDQRAAFYIEHRDLFIEQLKDEIAQLRRIAHCRGVTPAVRLNGTSDILWERLHRDVFDEFRDVQFYDYTKVRIRLSSFVSGSLGSKAWPGNYHLTFSGDGSQPDITKRILEAGVNVALVFWPELPKTWLGFPVIDGDTHDARFLDPAPVIVGLKAKGVARVDLDGFVVRACPHCESQVEQLKLVESVDDTHRRVKHECQQCGFQKESRWILPHALKAGALPSCSRKNSGRSLQLRLSC